MADARPRAGDRLVLLAILAFSADVLIFHFTILPLRRWSEASYGSPAWGIIAHYGLRGVSALLFGYAMVHWGAASTRDMGLAIRPMREDAWWFLKVVAGLAAVSVLYI